MSHCALQSAGVQIAMLRWYKYATFSTFVQSSHPCFDLQHRPLHVKGLWADGHSRHLGLKRTLKLKNKVAHVPTLWISKKRNFVIRSIKSRINLHCSGGIVMKWDEQRLTGRHINYFLSDKSQPNIRFSLSLNCNAFLSFFCQVFLHPSRRLLAPV